MADTTATPARLALGLDLGAASTRIALLDARKPMPRVIRNDLSNESTSTAVAYPSNEARCYGESAVSKQITRPSETVTDLVPWLFSKHEGDEMTTTTTTNKKERDDDDDNKKGNDADSKRDTNDDSARTRVSSTSEASASALPTRQIGSAQCHPAQVAAYFIKSILHFVPVDVATLPLCIAVPPCVTPPSVAALRQACLLAGLPPQHTHIVHGDEAVALYVHHMQYHQLPDDVASDTTAADTAEQPSQQSQQPMYVTVVDVGQSYSSASVLALTRRRVCKVATQSACVGSGDVDTLLCSYVYDELERTTAPAARAGLRGDVKAFRKVLRACRRAKEMLSTVPETRVQVEGLTSELDVNVLITRAVFDACCAPLREALQTMLTAIKPYTVPPRSATANARDDDDDNNDNNNNDNSSTSPRVEVIGGGWRTPCVSETILRVLSASRLGVSLDANLAVAEGAAILAEVCRRHRGSPLSPSPAANNNNNKDNNDDKDNNNNNNNDNNDDSDDAHPMHAVTLVGFAATDAQSPSTQPLSAADEAAVAEWAALEAKTAAADAAIHARLAAINELDSYLLQTLALVDGCDAPAHVKDELRAYLEPYNEYVRNGCCNSNSSSAAGNNDDDDKAASRVCDATSVIVDTLRRVQAHVAAHYPAIEQHKQALLAAEQRKTDELARLHEQRVNDDDGGASEPASDPQRLRLAQRRREQGQKLFKEELWAEAQRRFVQALAVLGQLYDTQSDDNRRTKREIELSCHLNIASCSVKLGLWRNAVNNCTSALELAPNTAKALFRRGQAYAAMKEYDAAIADLEKALPLSNGDAAVAAELQRAKTARDAQRARERAMFAKMFT